jgi:hypothetical protein
VGGTSVRAGDVSGRYTISDNDRQQCWCPNRRTNDHQVFHLDPLAAAF